MVIIWAITILFGWQLQGGVRQDIQVTERASVIQPAARADVFQGNQEDSDNLQPALGYNALNQPFTGTLEVR